jgi:hypothetical protein
MLINLIDPNDETVRGSLVHPDPIVAADVLAGAFVVFQIAETASSHDVKELFNLMSPPSFPGPFQVWGESVAGTGMLVLFLAPEAGDRNFRFALLNEFRFPRPGDVPTGTGQLFRHNKLPPNIRWQASLQDSPF